MLIKSLKIVHGFCPLKDIIRLTTSCSQLLSSIFSLPFRFLDTLIYIAPILDF